MFLQVACKMHASVVQVFANKYFENVNLHVAGQHCSSKNCMAAYN